MKGTQALAVGIAAGLTLAAGAGALTAADGGETAKAAAAVFQENPHQSDPALELQRLRNEGLAKYESGLALDDALRAFQQAFELGRQPADAYNAALVYFKKNHPSEAQTWLDKALAEDPAFPNALYLKGVLARADGDLGSAKSYWERARARAPDDSYLHYQLALVAQSERNEPAFLQSLVTALGLDPENPAALYQLYRHYQTSGNRELADQTMAKFNALKKIEKFSRREKQKDPSRLAQPVLAGAVGARGIEVIDVAPAFDLTVAQPGCTVLAADGYVRPGSTIAEGLALACSDGRLVRAETGAQDFSPAGKVPADTSDIRLEWFDAQGPRVLALTANGPRLARDLAGAGDDYADLPAKTAVPVVLADLDADGDLDIAQGGGQVPLTNAGKLTFTREEALYATDPLPGALDGARGAAVADLNRDGLSDLVILRDDALVVTTGSATGFRVALRLPAGAGAGALVVADFSNDGRLDLALQGPEGLRLIWNPDPQDPAATAPTTQIALPAGGGALLGALDYNNDGLLDLVVVAADGRATLLRNQGGRRFAELALGQWPKPARTARLLAWDPDLDGRVDLAYVTTDGALARARNLTVGGGTLIALFANGVRAAPSGLLTQVEARRGAGYAYAQSPGLVQRIGLGRSDYAEVLRLSWTNGFIENKLKIDATPKVYTFKESERISGSCPSLFVWNGERFEYFTDTFISGPAGVPLDRGRYFPIRDRETMVIPGDHFQLRDGRLEIRFTEELHESVFIDRARLLVVDHPQGTEIHPHSRLAPVPQPPELFYTAVDLVAPARATGSDGSDLTETLARVDRVHAEFLTRSPNSGYAEPHWIELEVPEAVDPAAIDALLATGWFFYFESTSMIAQAQLTGPNLPWPWLEQYLDGAWQEVAPVGIPTGKGKTAVVPLNGQLQSRRLRIRSGISIYWDRIAFAMHATPPALTTTEAPLAEATLRFRGFSELIARNPERFDYYSLRYRALWSPMRGRFTDYGPVEALVDTADGRYALFGSGDEMALSFQIDTPPPPAGQTRSYLLEFVGYVKDADRYTAHPGEVDPMPYLGLVQYPPPADERLKEAETRSPQRHRAPLNYTLDAIGAQTEPAP